MCNIPSSLIRNKGRIGNLLCWRQKSCRLNETGKFVERFWQCSQSVYNGTILGDPGGLWIEIAAGWVWTGEWNSEELPPKRNEKKRTTGFVGAFHQNIGSCWCITKALLVLWDIRVENRGGKCSLLLQRRSKWLPASTEHLRKEKFQQCSHQVFQSFSILLRSSNSPSLNVSRLLVEGGGCLLKFPV